MTSCTTRSPPGSAPSEPVALATVIDGPRRGAKLLVAPGSRAARLARRPRARPRRRPGRARRAGGGPVRSPPLRAARRDDARGSGRFADRARVRRVPRRAAADVDLRRRRLHRRAGEGRQGPRLPRHGVRRPRGVRHPPPLPDGRRGRRVVADAAVRRARRDPRAAATRCASSPTTPSSTCRPWSARSPRASATSA